MNNKKINLTSFTSTNTFNKSLKAVIKKWYFVLPLLILLTIVSINFAQYFKGNNPKKEFALPKVNSDKCSSNQKIVIPTTFLIDNDYIKKLNEYQTICDSFAFNQMMIFSYMPQGNEAIANEAKNLGSKILAFEKIGIKPLIVFEPTAETGNLNFKKLENNEYKPTLKQFISALIANGVNENNIGDIIPFPEPNIPAWDRLNATPKSFALSFNNFVETIREDFKDMKGITLLNTKTYQESDKNWAFGKIESPKPWVEDIKKEYLLKVGLQGFPWQSPNNEKILLDTDVKEYLPLSSIDEMIKVTQTKEIFLNTGTFYKKYTQDKKRSISVSAKERKKILEELLYQSNKIQEKGVNLTINLFAEDKSKTPEDTDWSYKTTDDQAILKEFLARAEIMKIKMAVFNK